MTLRPAAFLDRDGVINLDRGYVARAADFEFVTGVFDGAAALQRLGFALVGHHQPFGHRPEPVFGK